MRVLDRLDAEERKFRLLEGLLYGMREVATGKRRTDAVGVACHYGRWLGVRRSDYDGMLDKTLRELGA